MLPTSIPLVAYFDQSGQTLNGGYVYFGSPNQNPETAPITVYWDAAGTQPAAQPLRTVNGYIVRSGQPANVFAGSEYSIAIKDAKGSLVKYSRSSNEFDGSAILLGELSSSNGASLIGSASQVVNSISDLRALLKTSPSKNALVTGYYAKGDGGGGHYYYDSTDTTSADDGGSIIVATDGGRWKLIRSNAVTLAQFGALPSRTAAQNTSIVQFVFDNFSNIEVNNGAYKIDTLVVSRAGQTVTFHNAFLQGDSNSAQQAVVDFRNGQSVWYNPQINCNFKTNYKSAINFRSLDGITYPGHLTIYNPTIVNSKIGILYGELTGGFTAPISENHIFGGYMRGVERNIFSYQQNGILYLHGMVLDCNQYEFPGGDFSNTVACLVENKLGLMYLLGCTCNKTVSALGFGFINSHIINVEGGSAEIAGTNAFLFGGSETTFDGYQNNFMSDTTAPVILLEDGSVGGSLIWINSNVTRTSDADAAPLVATKAATGWEIQLLGGRLTNQNGDYIINSTYGRNTLCKVTAQDLEVSSPSNYGGYRRFSTGLINQAWYWNNGIDIARFDVTAGAGCTASIVTDALATQPIRSLKLAYDGVDPAAQLLVYTKIDIDQAVVPNDRMLTLDFWQKTGLGTFNGRLQALYYDGNVANLLKVLELGDGAGSVGNIVVDPGAPIGYIQNRFFIPVLDNATEIRIGWLVQSSATQWYIKNIRIY